MEKERMARITRDKGSCPVCGHKNFLISSIIHNVYLTDSFNNIIDTKELTEDVVGVCLNCNSNINFIPTPTGFYAVGKIEKIVLENTIKNENKPDDYVELHNPMEPS